MVQGQQRTLLSSTFAARVLQGVYIYTASIDQNMFVVGPNKQTEKNKYIPRFESPVAPLFHWVATLGKLFTHIASPVSQLQETGVQKEFSAPKWLWWLSALD